MSEPLTPQQRMADKAAKTLPGLTAAGKAVGLANHREILADARRRTHDGHRAQMLALGMPDPGPSPENGADMGDLIICGDIHATNPADVIQALRTGKATVCDVGESVRTTPAAGVAIDAPAATLSPLSPVAAGLGKLAIKYGVPPLLALAGAAMGYFAGRPPTSTQEQPPAVAVQKMPQMSDYDVKGLATPPEGYSR